MDKFDFANLARYCIEFYQRKMGDEIPEQLKTDLHELIVVFTEMETRTRPRRKSMLREFEAASLTHYCIQYYRREMSDEIPPRLAKDLDTLIEVFEQIAQDEGKGKKWDIRKAYYPQPNEWEKLPLEILSKLKIAELI